MRLKRFGLRYLYGIAIFNRSSKRDHDVSWLKDGIALNPQGLLRGTGEIYNGHADTTGGGYLVLRNVTVRDEGNYSCRVGSRLHKRTFISTSNRIHIRIQCEHP